MLFRKWSDRDADETRGVVACGCVFRENVTRARVFVALSLSLSRGSELFAVGVFRESSETRSSIVGIFAYALTFSPQPRSHTLLSTVFSFFPHSRTIDMQPVNNSGLQFFFIMWKISRKMYERTSQNTGAEQGWKVGARP